MRGHHLARFALLAVLLPCAGAAPAPKQYREAAISPDGRMLAWVEGNADTAIYVLSLPDAAARPRRVTAGNGTKRCAERHVAWSPDSSRLAFLSDCTSPKQAQLYVGPPAGPARRLTSLSGFLAGPRWSPDGRTIGLLYTENAVRAAGPVEALAPETGVIESKIYEQRLTLVDAATGRARQISPPDMYVYEYDWAPASDRIVYTAARGAGDDNWYIARLYTIDAASGAARELLDPRMQIAVPRWSPDGRTIAFIGGLMSDEGLTGGEVYTIPATSGPARRVANETTSPAWLAWLPGSRRMLVTERADGGASLATIDAETGAREEIWRADESIQAGAEGWSLSLAADANTAAVIRSSWSEPPAVWTGPPGKWQRRTEMPAGARPAWGKAQKLHWRSDSFSVQGWLVYPADFDPHRRYPLIVWVHGGPAYMESPQWPGGWGPVSFASRGYFVLFPNPRGSLGSGERFTTANVKDFGHGDLRDILAGVDKAIETAPLDPNRIGIAGWSYGGYMAMWAVTQTDRFHAAVAGAGVANWQSYFGENAIDQWLMPYFGASVYDDPAVYARSSPINFIRNAKTPSLVLVGERDGECPPPQSYEFWHALKWLGVKTQLVVYANEGHGFRDARHIADRAARMTAWFDENLR